MAALLLLAPQARADAPAGAGAGLVLPSDPVLAGLLEQSLAARPELRQADAAARAERERIPQAGALPDPVLTLGIQNDGFGEIMVGKMETSFYQVMVSQGLPWPGKRGLRTDVARLAADEAGASLSRARLTTEADVRRAYLDLLLARDRLDLLARLEGIWTTSAGFARSRYESGEGAQSDVLRAQLELNRLRQRRFGLEAQERTAVQTLNRLRGSPVDEPIPTSTSVRDLTLPELPAVDAALADALARSPELAQARLGSARAEKSVALARRERFPDLSVNAGVMPRGQLEPMWLASVSIGLPVWSHRKQNRAVAESAARAEAGASAAQAIEQVLRLRVAERRTAYAAVADTARLFREGLLVQSRATAESTLAQYRVGKVTFASVLEANAGYVADEDGFLGAVAEAQRIAIGEAEVSLDPVGAPGAGGAMATGGVPGAGAAGGGGAGVASAAAAPSAAAASSSGSMTSGM
ncbi:MULTISPECIES: TolC family protein [Anaeromyxobacter]|uniref:TolC family protein n=2 Tax=Anaeromyxobacteraceae TaxID=1524215 RepID=UPI001F568325|nr:MULTISPECIES: TolC family protein [unclassified Anaeromyxobacter]